MSKTHLTDMYINHIVVRDIENISHRYTHTYAEQIKRGSTGSMLQEHFIISGTFESETHTNNQPDLIINKIFEYQ